MSVYVFFPDHCDKHEHISQHPRPPHKLAHPVRYPVNLMTLLADLCAAQVLKLARDRHIKASADATISAEDRRKSKKAGNAFDAAVKAASTPAQVWTWGASTSVQVWTWGASTPAQVWTWGASTSAQVWTWSGEDEAFEKTFEKEKKGGGVVRVDISCL